MTGGHDVTFACGARRRFDLVVGADGLHSALRAMVFGPHERFVRHLGHVMAFYTVPNEFGLDRWLIDYRDVAAQKRLLRERMAGLGWLAPRILAHLDHTPDFYLDQVAQVVMDHWSSGRVGLLGDAAFSSSPLSGQGTGLALVGAYLLAGELAAAGPDAEPGPDFNAEWFTELIERALNGAELPDYAGVPDSGAPSWPA
jgi:2-polyprenyl-6-methoxyphenol hydroxylase-like FAD-dependent oxidoreductase